MRNRMEQLKQRLRKQSGFTLIELMATLGILALIVAIAVPAIGSIMNDAETGSREASIAMIEEAAALAELGDLEPSSVVEATTDDNGTPDDPSDDITTPELKSYTVPALITGGYLDLEADHDLNLDTVVAEEQANGSYKVTGVPAS